MMGRRLISWREFTCSDPLLPHPLSKTWSHAVLALLSEGYPPPRGRLPTCYSPVRRFTGIAPFSLDLHVLGAPLTFVLSQDQTLQLNPVSVAPARGTDSLMLKGMTWFEVRLRHLAAPLHRPRGPTSCPGPLKRSLVGIQSSFQGPSRVTLYARPVVC